MKAVIPAAGLGTRFLPYTKSQPKEMLPIVDKPAIQYVVEEAARSGLKDILIVTGRTKRAIEDHFDRNLELEDYLSRRGRKAELRVVREVDELANIMFVRQKEPLGLGHAVLSAERYVAGEPFAVLLGDDVCIDGVPCIRQLMDVHAKTGQSVLAIQHVGRSRVGKYGVVGGRMVKADLMEIESIVEKPKPSEAPSEWATIGRYVLEPSILEHLRRVHPDRRGELQLTAAISSLLEEHTIYGRVYRGRRYDIGDRADWLRANIELAPKGLLMGRRAPARVGKAGGRGSRSAPERHGWVPRHDDH